jgi:hypothetical protein
MRKADVEKILGRRPFVPLSIHLDDGSVVAVPFSHISIPFKTTLIVMQGVKAEGSRSATGTKEFAYDRIVRIEPRKSRNGRLRRKAS